MEKYGKTENGFLSQGHPGGTGSAPVSALCTRYKEARKALLTGMEAMVGQYVRYEGRLGKIQDISCDSEVSFVLWLCQWEPAHAGGKALLKEGYVKVPVLIDGAFPFTVLEGPEFYQAFYHEAIWETGKFTMELSFRDQNRMWRMSAVIKDALERPKETLYEILKGHGLNCQEAESLPANHIRLLTELLASFQEHLPESYEGFRYPDQNIRIMGIRAHGEHKLNILLEGEPPEQPVRAILRSFGDPAGISLAAICEVQAF